MRNKFSELEEIAFTGHYDIIGVTESWLNLEVRDYLAEYNIPGYTIFEKSRVHRNGGGILLYIKSSLNPVQISKPLIANVDALYVLLKGNSETKLAIVLIYRPPAQTVQTDRDFYDQISEVSDIYDAIILGDFNLPVTQWGKQLTSHHGHQLYINLQESSLAQFVNYPTRENHILDLVFATKDELVKDLNVGSEFSGSDHREITFTINFMTSDFNQSKEKVLDFRKANFLKLRSMFKQTDWRHLRSSIDVDAKWKFFTDKYFKIVQECVPMKNRRPPKVKPKWWNKQITECLRDKKDAHIKYKSNNNNENYTKFVELRRKAKKLIKQSKRSTEIHVANQSKTNPKEFFSFIRQKRVTTSSIGPLINENGDYISEDEQVCCILNSFFSSVFTEEDLNRIPTMPDVLINNNEVLNNITVTESDVLKCIDKLKVNKSPGPDAVSPRILKEAKLELVTPLTLLFNESLQFGTMPHEWKLANVTPIFKKGSKSLPCNYRPISLTSVVCKMLETLIRNKLVNHLEEKKLT